LIRHPLIIAPIGAQRQALLTERLPCAPIVGRFPLRSQTEKRQATEAALAVDVLNRMLALGRPSYVRIV
jgi:hypothetical protein